MSEKIEDNFNALARDAARYRWLRTYWRRVVTRSDGERIVWMSLHSDNSIATNEDTVDAAIDKAMEQT